MSWFLKEALKLIESFTETAAKYGSMTPEELVEKIRTEIKEDKYRGDMSLTEFEIPEGVVKIGDGAFRECKNLRRVTFPSTLKYIGRHAFHDCVSLADVKFPPSLGYIGYNAFTGCDLKEVYVPEGVTFIGNGAFSECESLVTAVLPQSMNGTEICGGLFYRCKSLENVTFPKRIIKSFANVFPHCESLKSFEIPCGADEIGSFTFEYCSALESLIIPDTVKKIGHRSIMYCTSLKDIYIPDSVETISSVHTFQRCHSLSKVRLPLAVEFVNFLDYDPEDKAAFCFDNCPELHTVEMCGREFHVDKIGDAALLLIRAELAADGVDEALPYVQRQFAEVFKAIVNEDRTELADRLLERLPREQVKPDDLLAAIDHAAMTGAHQIYLLLVKFGDLGEDPDPDEIRKRFDL